MLLDMLEEYRKTHQLSIPECAKLIGVSVQTLYNVKDGKSIKLGTLTKIQSFISNAHEKPEATKLQRLFEEYERSYLRYHELLMKEWQEKFSQLDPKDHAKLAELTEKMREVHEQLNGYHQLLTEIIHK